MAYRYTPAFVAYCKGTPTDEISVAFKIPLKSLKAKMREEGWRGLADKLVEQIPIPNRRDEGALAKCEANRAKNFEMAEKLREDLLVALDHLRAGTLRIAKQWHNRGDVVEFEAELTVADRLALANYATIIANLTYRALGDCGPSEGTEARDASSPPPPISVILPGLIAEPRMKRADVTQVEAPTSAQANLLTDGE